MRTEGTFEIYALRFATRESTKSQEFFRYEVYRSPDSFQRLDYFFWLVKNDTFTVLVDCGFNRERGLTKGRPQETSPLALLERMGVAPSDVDFVIITHMHYDHVGNVDLFPNAVVILARDEYEFWAGPYGSREIMRSIVFPEEVSLVQDIERQGRLRLIGDSTEVVPGVLARKLGGHTPGQVIVEVQSPSESIVLASDAAHYYEEIELDRPYKLYDDIGKMYGALDALRELARRPNTTVVAGHDPRVTEMFHAVEPNCFDLTARRKIG